MPLIRAACPTRLLLLVPRTTAARATFSTLNPRFYFKNRPIPISDLGIVCAFDVCGSSALDIPALFATFTIIEGVDFMGWLYESIKRRHREEGRAEGREEGRRERDQAYREWISREQEAGTLGTPKQSPPPFLDDAFSESKRD